jgi:hypothetical protein
MECSLNFLPRIAASIEGGAIWNFSYDVNSLQSSKGGLLGNVLGLYMYILFVNGS